MDSQNSSLKKVIEALLFASSIPLSIKKIQSILKEDFEVNKNEILSEIESLKKEYQISDRAFELKEIADGYILQTLPIYEGHLQKLYPSKAIKLAPSALEVLAIIAYKQPITRVEIEHIRGVDCSYSITQLLERQLVSNDNKLDAPGQPALFETTPFFLEYFGLKNLSELPKLPEGEYSTTPSTP